MCGNLKTYYDSADPESRSALIRNAHGHYTANHINNCGNPDTRPWTKREGELKTKVCPVLQPVLRLPDILIVDNG